MIIQNYQIGKLMNQNKTITHIWTRVNPKWLVSGAISGILAGSIVLAVACLIAIKTEGEWSQPLKLLGSMCYGGDAMAFGPVGAVGFYGLGLHLILSTIYGLTFTQLVDEKSKPLSLVILGVVTSLVIWVFGCQLFMPSFNYYLYDALTTVSAVLFHILFGATFGIILSAIESKSK